MTLLGWICGLGTVLIVALSLVAIYTEDDPLTGETHAHMVERTRRQKRES